MSQFIVLTKLWPTGDSLAPPVISSGFTIPPSTPHFDHHADKFQASMDGVHNFEFLFWNTGRHVTNKRHVIWDFSQPGWGTWTATKWYGTPPSGPPGSQRVRVDAFSIADDGPITSGGSPIADPPASTFPASAFPFMGDNHAIGTASGPVDVAAKDPFASLQFAGWDQLVWGGDDSNVFFESDSGGGPGSPSFFPVGVGTFHVNQNQSADLLALYGNSSRPSISSILGSLGLGAFVAGGGVPSPVDPSPLDRIRLAVLESLLQQSKPGGVQGIDFQTIAGAAPRMSVDELKAALKSVQTSVALGQSAVSTIEAQIKAKTK